MEMDGILKEKNSFGSNHQYLKGGHPVIIISFVSIIVVILGISFLLFKDGVRSSRDWYIVYLNNNQVYFGRVEKLSDTNLSLRNAYGLQSVEMPAGENATSSAFMVEALKKWHTVVPLNQEVVNIDKSEIVFLGKADEQIGIMSVIRNLDKGK